MLPVTTPKSTNENSSASDMRSTFNVRLPIRFEPNSLSRAVAVHENATPIEISSPKYAIVPLWLKIFHYFTGVSLFPAAKLHIFIEIPDRQRKNLLLSASV